MRAAKKKRTSAIYGNPSEFNIPANAHWWDILVKREGVQSWFQGSPGRKKTKQLSAVSL